jgi:hypothetical protein
MSGILDNKSRVIDAILTYEGRRQMAEGTFSINYATFSDAFVVYEPSDIDGHVDPTTKIYLEAFNVPHDQITFEADDSGRLSPFNQVFSEQKNLLNAGKIKKIETNFISGKTSDVIISGSAFASQIESILTSSVDNFKKLQVIGTIDRLYNDDQFALTTNEINFDIKDNLENLRLSTPTFADATDSLFNDKKLRNLINFRWLPPIKKIQKNELVDKTNSIDLDQRNLGLGVYPPWGPVEKLTFSDIKNELANYESTAKTIYFDPTSRDNDIVAQFFEITDNQANKLDVIDYGKVYDSSQNVKMATHHVFFVGKLITDDNGTDCFIHLFTLLFGSADEDITV